MKQNFFLILFLTAINCLFAQSNATITVTEITSGNPIQGASVTLNNVAVQTDAVGQAIFSNLANGSYSYTISKTCYLPTNDNVVIAGANVAVNKTITAVTTNDVNISMSNFGFNPSGFSINLTNGTFNQTITSGNPLGDFFASVPFGTYTYTISKNCFQTATGQVIVNCNAGDPNFVSSIPVAQNTNDVNISMSNFGFNPSGFSINLTNGTFNQTITSGNPLGDFFASVPFGTYTYTISKNCFQTATGQVIVNCNAGDPNFVSSIPVALTTNDVNISMSNFGFNPSGFSINLTNGTFNQTITSGNPLGDFFAAVPFGTYTYTISKNCFQTATGQVIVNCNAGDPNFISSIPVAVTTNDVNISMSNFGFNPSGFSINLTNGTFNQTITSGNPLGDFFAAVPFGTYTYTISKNCFQTATGQIIVNCNAGDPNFVSSIPMAVTTNDVNISMSNFGFNPSGFSITLSSGTFNQTITSGNPLGDFFAAVPFGTYTYTISKNCFQTATGQVIVNCNAGDPNFVSSIPVAVTTNDVNISMSNFGFNPSGFSINLTNGTFNQTITSGNPLGDFFAAVPFGTYTYTISKNCFQTATGQVIVNCNAGDPNFVSSIPVAVTTNDVNISMSNFGFNPSGFSINLTNGTFNQTITSGNPLGDFFAAVPFGTYTYTISKNCFQTATGQVIVNCNAGDPNFVSSIPVAVTTNDVNISMSNFGFNPSGFSINLTNGTFNQTITSGDPLGDFFAAVPFGTYTYTISKNCFQTATGQVVVNCNAGDPNFVSSIPVATVLDNTVVQNENILTANATGVTYQWLDCNNNNEPIANATTQIFTATVDGSYAVEISSENCSVISTCFIVSNLSTADIQKTTTMTVFPNPASDNITVKFERNFEMLTVEIISMTGQVVKRTAATQHNMVTINISELASGVYILRTDDKQNTTTSRIVKK
ncbi:T9SS type A sorting domain-containing protein [Flavobacterium sp. SM2513]|uniref:T9SS type A sorting domain-containing protein n=1 Tax=Flavobacterium sp. SM2513 TaxID=3424766 RepID=UPI003D7F34AE